MIGQLFGQLAVIAQCIKGDGQTAFTCVCTCGEIKIVRSSNLRNGSTRSCGCRPSLRNTKHGHIKGYRPTSEYKAWQSMKERCHVTTNASYADYGGRGIKVCARWAQSFENFLADMGPKPSTKHSLDRYPDHNGNYEPTNCRWATWHEQANNRRKRKTK